MTLFVLMSHRLGENQAREVCERWQVEETVYLPVDLQGLWSGVDPHGPFAPESFQPVLIWLRDRARPGDRVIVQGEYGLTVYFVMACWSLGLVPIYATSERVYQEEPGPGGTVLRRHAFRHVHFREYVRGKE